MPDVTSESAKLRPWSGDRAPASWGLGDGQAIPGKYAPAPESREIVAKEEIFGPVLSALTFLTPETAVEKASNKESGFGREGGMHGLHAYVRLEDR